MRLRRLEFAVIALTFAFICFMGGYFTGRRGAVNIVSVASQSGKMQTFYIDAAPEPGSGNALPEADTAPGAPVHGEDSASGGVITDGSATTGGGETAAAQQLDVIGMPRDSDGRININYASISELMDLPGIGSVLAGRIVDYRLLNGPFSRIEDLRNVSGIGAKRFEAIQDRIVVG